MIIILNLLNSYHCLILFSRGAIYNDDICINLRGDQRILMKMMRKSDRLIAALLLCLHSQFTQLFINALVFIRRCWEWCYDVFEWVVLYQWVHFTEKKKETLFFYRFQLQRYASNNKNLISIFDDMRGFIYLFFCICIVMKYADISCKILTLFS